MTIAIGVVLTDHITAGRLEDRQLTGRPLRYPIDRAEVDALITIPAGELVEMIAEHVHALAGHGSAADAIGVAVPGIVRAGIVEDSPNLPQIKGSNLAE